MGLSDLWGPQDKSVAAPTYDPTTAGWTFEPLDSDGIEVAITGLRLNNDVKGGKTETIARIVVSTARILDRDDKENFMTSLPNDVAKIILRTDTLSDISESDFDALSSIISHLRPDQERELLNSVTTAICSKPLSQLVQSRQLEGELELQG